MCRATTDQRPILDEDVRGTPDWCPAATGLMVKLKPMPEGYHVWKGGDECEVCGLTRRLVSYRGRRLCEYRVNEEWTLKRPDCKSPDTRRG